MSTTDLLNGSISGLPSYNVKNNPSVFNLNPLNKINYYRQCLLAISFNHVFIDVVTDLVNLGRDYYNKNPRKFCSTVQLNPVQGFGGKEITVYLPSAGGVIDNSIEYIKIDNIRTTWLMRVLNNSILPTCWSNIVKPNGSWQTPAQNASPCVNFSITPEQAPFILSKNEQVLYYYIRNANFFTRTLQLLANSFRVFSEQRFQCYTLVFPKDLYAGTKKQRTITVTNDFLKSIYSQYLKYSRGICPYRLPAPIIDNIPYTIPTQLVYNTGGNPSNLTDTHLTEPELTEIMNNNSDSFTI